MLLITHGCVPPDGARGQGYKFPWLHTVFNRSKPTNMTETEYFVRLNYALKKYNIFPAAFLMGAAARARATWLHERPSRKTLCKCFHNFDLFRLDTEKRETCVPSRKKTSKTVQGSGACVCGRASTITPSTITPVGGQLASRWVFGSLHNRKATIWRKQCELF